MPPTETGPPEQLRARPPYLFPAYASTALRAPHRKLLVLPESLRDRTGPLFGHLTPDQLDADLTRQHPGEPLGERIIVAGRVSDGEGRPVRHQLVEIWQANSAGRYRHDGDIHPAPLDPNFTGAGRVLTDYEGRYRFVSIKPGAYPWRNHQNAWRPAHIHLSLFGSAFSERLITQMYFPGDPLMDRDPVSQSLEPRARERLVAYFSLDLTEPEWALGFQFDIVLDGAAATPLERGGAE